MILINGKKIEEKINEVKKPIVFELVDTYFRRETIEDSNGNRVSRRRAAETVLFNPFCTIMDEKTNQTVELRYAETVNTRESIGGVINHYTPNKIVFTNGRLIVYPGQNDLYYFLMNCPWLEKDDKSNAGNAKFRINNQTKFAEKALEKRKTKRIAEDLILGSKGDALDIAELRMILSSYDEFAGDISNMADTQVRNELLTIMERDPEAFYDNALSVRTMSKATVQEAVALKRIEYDANTNKWKWTSPAKAGNSEIVAVPAGQDKLTWFADWLFDKDRTNVLDEIKKQVAEAKSSKKKEKESVFV